MKNNIAKGLLYGVIMTIISAGLLVPYAYVPEQGYGFFLFDGPDGWKLPFGILLWRTGLTWRRIGLEMGRIHTVTLTRTAGTVTQTTPLTDIQQSIVDACGVAAPPRVTHLHPS